MAKFFRGMLGCKSVPDLSSAWSQSLILGNSKLICLLSSIVLWSKQLCLILCRSLSCSSSTAANYFFTFSDDGWRVFLKRFATSVQHITGQEVEVKALGETSSSDIVEQELESLRLKVEELSDEVNVFNVVWCSSLIFSYSANRIA